MTLSTLSRRRFVRIAVMAGSYVAAVLGVRRACAAAEDKQSGASGTTALNLTLRIKQDAETQRRLKDLKDNFAALIQPKIDAELKRSQIVHFARVVVIDDKYIQVLTEFDGDKRAYTDFFLDALPDVFRAVFSLAEGAPPWDQLKHHDSFYEFSSKANLRSLGTKADDPDAGYLFSGYPGRSVQQILAKFAGE